MSGWLVDKSALVRLSAAPDAEQWRNRIERGLVAISTVTRLEVGFSARDARQHAVLLHFPPVAAMPVEYLTPSMEERTVAVQALLAARGQHRAPSIPDLLVAATAEICGRTVLHCDKDFDLIASLTAQPVETLRF